MGRPLSLSLVGQCGFATNGGHIVLSQLRRGLVRQLGKPALLAATYKGDAAAIATAAMEELESTLVDTLTQLERSSPATPGAHLSPQIFQITEC